MNPMRPPHGVPCSEQTEGGLFRNGVARNAASWHDAVQAEGTAILPAKPSRLVLVVTK